MANSIRQGRQVPLFVFHLLPASGQKLARVLFYIHVEASVEVKTNFTERNPYVLRRAPAEGAEVYVPPEAADQPKTIEV